MATIIKEPRAKATRQVITLQAHVDSAPAIEGVNLALDGNRFKQVRIKVADYPGLALQCTPKAESDGSYTFAKSWCFRGTDKNGAEVFRGLGSAVSTTLAAARKLADSLRTELASGATHISQRSQRATSGREETTSTAPAPKTFQEVTEHFIDRAKTRWAARDGSTEDFWRSAMRRYVCPVIGSLPVDAITRQQVLEIIDPLWTQKRPTAERVHPMIREVIDYAIARGFCRERINPAAWEQLEGGLADTSNKVVKHHIPLYTVNRDG